jgi:hypothetical protein
MSMAWNPVVGKGPETWGARAVSGTRDDTAAGPIMEQIMVERDQGNTAVVRIRGDVDDEDGVLQGHHAVVADVAAVDDGTIRERHPAVVADIPLAEECTIDERHRAVVAHIPTPSERPIGEGDGPVVAEVATAGERTVGEGQRAVVTQAIPLTERAIHDCHRAVVTDASAETMHVTGERTVGEDDGPEVSDGARAISQREPIKRQSAGFSDLEEAKVGGHGRPLNDRWCSHGALDRERGRDGRQAVGAIDRGVVDRGQRVRACRQRNRIGLPSGIGPRYGVDQARDLPARTTQLSGGDGVRQDEGQCADDLNEHPHRPSNHGDISCCGLLRHQRSAVIADNVQVWSTIGRPFPHSTPRIR